MIQVERFRPEHLQLVEVQDAQACSMALFSDPSYGEAIAAGPYAFTTSAQGRVLMVSGLVVEWNGRGVLWSVLSRHAGPYFRSIHRATLGFLAQSPVRRIEMAVKTDFPAGHRWARMLGMQREGTMRGYSPAGDDYDLYARIRT